MALTATQLVTISEITQETLETITSLASSLTAEQETWIGTEITLWNTNRNKLKVELDGDLKYQMRTLLSTIRMRVRKMFGLSLFSDEVLPGSRSIPHTWIY